MSKRGRAAALVLWAFAAAAQAAAVPDFTGLVKRNNAAVVNISSQGKAVRAEAERDDDEDGPEHGDESLGTGLIVSADGYLLTNQHVIEDADEIIVRLVDRRELSARVVGTDARTDLAVLKIEGAGFPVAALGRAHELEVGEWVLAIGSPFGFEQSVTAGIVSAKGRSLPTEPYVAFIQTDVAINPGNSGGPLINMKGEVVGINSQIYSQTGGYMGVSFAIPIETAVEVTRQIRTQGRVSRGWLGVLVQPVNRELAEAFGMSVPAGALVTRVFAGGPAEAAGLRPGDIVTRFDGRAVDVSTALPALVGSAPVGKTVPLTVLREGQEHKLQLELAELPEAEPDAEPPAQPAPQRQPNRLGLRVAPVPAELRESLGLAVGGVVVEGVDNDRAARAGLRPGDVLGRINGQAIDSAEALERQLAGLPAGRSVALLVLRRSGPFYLALRVPQ